MVFWIFMVIMLLLTPAIMIIWGKKFIKAAPVEINTIYGYRTSMSMKNQDTWKFAHSYCGKIWYHTGKILLVSLLLMFFVLGKDEDTVGYFGMILLVVQIISLVGAIVLGDERRRWK